MARPVSLKRSAFPNRPWITSPALYDLLSSPRVMHCDAYLVQRGAHGFLVMDWREAGFRRLALSAWLTEPDGITPVWDAAAVMRDGTPAFWNRHNGAYVSRLHAFVLSQAQLVEASGRWARVSVQAHYVHATDKCYEPANNQWKPRAERKVRSDKGGTHGSGKPKGLGIPDLL